MSADTDFVSFRYEGTNANWGFSSYKDKTGKIQRFVESKDGSKVKYKHISFASNRRMLRFHISQKKLIEYVRNHPNCPESENYCDVMIFKEWSPIKDAEVKNTLRKLQNKAASMAMELDEVECREVAALFGHFTDSYEMQLDSLLTRAEKEPRKLIDIIKSPDRYVRSLLKIGISRKIFTTMGTTIMYNNIKLGVTEDFAVSKLLADADLLENVEHYMQQSGISIAKRTEEDTPGAEKLTASKGGAKGSATKTNAKGAASKGGAKTTTKANTGKKSDDGGNEDGDQTETSDEAK